MPTSEYDAILARQRTYVADFVRKCAAESEQDEKQPRRRKNNKNWDYFHGNIDWSHKDENDPVIHLHKVGVAAERIRSKFKSALMNYDHWLQVDRIKDAPQSVLSEHTARSLLFNQFEKAQAANKISDAILNGAVESRMTIKVSGCYKTKPRYVKKGDDTVREEKKVWQLDLPALGFEVFKPDTKSADYPLYEIEEFRTDYYRVLYMASEKGDDPSKPFRLEACKKLGAFPERTQDQASNRAEGNLDKMDRLKERKQVLIQNFYGTILAEDGSIYEWQSEDGSKAPLENICCVVGNESEVLLDPRRIERWSGKSGYIYIDPLRSPGTGRKAILDAGTDINHAENELFSLMLAGGIKSVHNVTWSRPSWIANKEALTGGVKDGENLEMTDSAPINAVPFGTVPTGKIPPETITMTGMLDTVFAENVISNRLDLSGDMGDKGTLATQINSAKTAIADVFDSFSMDIEKGFVVPLAEEALLEIVQHVDEMDPDEVRACFGAEQEQVEAFLKMSPKQRASQVLGVFAFKGRGLKGIIANMAHAQALINLLNAMAANPIMMQAVESQVSASKIFLHIADLMAIDPEKISPDAQERQLIEDKQRIREMAISMAQQPGAEGGQGSPQQPGSGQPAPTNGMQGF